MRRGGGGWAFWSFCEQAGLLHGSFVVARWVGRGTAHRAVPPQEGTAQRAGSRSLRRYEPDQVQGILLSPSWDAPSERGHCMGSGGGVLGGRGTARRAGAPGTERRFWRDWWQLGRAASGFVDRGLMRPSRSRSGWSDFLTGFFWGERGCLGAPLALITCTLWPVVWTSHVWLGVADDQA